MKDSGRPHEVIGTSGMSENLIVTRPAENQARGRCLSCGYSFRLRKDGTVQRHRLYSGLRSYWCVGSWQIPHPPATTRRDVFVDGVFFHSRTTVPSQAENQQTVEAAALTIGNALHRWVGGGVEKELARAALRDLVAQAAIGRETLQKLADADGIKNPTFRNPHMIAADALARLDGAR